MDTRHEFSVVQGNSESLFEPWKISQMQPILLFSFSRRASLQSTSPRTKIINARRGTDDADTDLLRFLCPLVRAIEKKAVFRMRRRLFEIELQQRLIEM